MRRSKYFAFKGVYDKSVGHVYACDFTPDGETVIGLDRARWVRRWDVQSDLITWEAETQQAKAELKRLKLEKEGNVSEIELLLLPMRRRYEAARKRYDMSACRALEEAMLQALRTPVRSTEK